MPIRRISYASFSRNLNYWLDLQEQGDEIHLIRTGEVAAVLYPIIYGEPVQTENELKSFEIATDTLLFQTPSKGCKTRQLPGRAARPRLHKRVLGHLQKSALAIHE